MNSDKDEWNRAVLSMKNDEFTMPTICSTLTLGYSFGLASITGGKHLFLLNGPNRYRVPVSELRCQGRAARREQIATPPTTDLKGQSIVDIPGIIDDKKKTSISNERSEHLSQRGNTL